MLQNNYMLCKLHSKDINVNHIRKINLQEKKGNQREEKKITNCFGDIILLHD